MEWDLPGRYRQRPNRDATQTRVPEIVELLGRPDYRQPRETSTDLLGRYGRPHGQDEGRRLEQLGRRLLGRRPYAAPVQPEGHRYGLAFDLGEADQELPYGRHQGKERRRRLGMAVGRERRRSAPGSAVGGHLAPPTDQIVIK